MAATKQVATFTLNLPVADDAIGRWMEANGASLSLDCAFGVYTATLGMRRVIASNDTFGFLYATWEVSRHGPDKAVAIRDVFEFVMANIEHAFPKDVIDGYVQRIGAPIAKARDAKEK